MKKVLSILGVVVGVLVALAALLVLALTLTEFKPRDVEPLEVSQGGAGRSFAPGSQLTVLSWNIGYGALGDNADFFMDGGSMVQTADQNRVTENLMGIRQTLSEQAPDLCFLQEVDIGSTRSYHTDERDVLSQGLPDASSVFATNYKSLFVPYPIPPIGQVHGGLVTFSQADILSAERRSLPCPFSWPIRLAQLKRCLLVTRIPLSGTDKELVAVNLHLEAYDDGSGRAAQTKTLSEFLIAEAQKGNYVIAGGDFNQSLSTANPAYLNVRAGLWSPDTLDADAFGEGLSLLMPENAPSCRSLDQPLVGADKNIFQFYQIDGFIVSSNVSVEALETLDKGFVNADHNPVRMTVTLRP